MRKFIRTFRVTRFLIFLLLVFHCASAQTSIVKGTVIDANGNPLADASVTVEGKKSAAITDAEVIIPLNYLPVNTIL